MITTKSKKILSAIMAICLVFGSAAALPRNAFTDSTSVIASAKDDQQGLPEDTQEKVTEDGIRYIVQDGKVFVTGCEGEQPNLIIPATIDGKKVTTITQGAFAGKEHIRHIKISEGITDIEMNAFADCSSVEEVTIPKSCKKIADRAFLNCFKLKAIDLGNVEYLGQEAFKATGIETVTVPDSAAVIFDGVFAECWNLKTAVLGKGTTAVPGAMFMNCESLTKVTIPNKYNYIGDAAFMGCAKLEAVDLPSDLTAIGNNAFTDSGIKSIKLPKATTKLGNWAFMNTKLGVKDINLENITEMGREVFLNTPWLDEMKKKGELVIVNDILVDSSGFKGKTLTVPKGVKTIAGQGISHVTNLEKVIIPEGVETIGDNAFDSDMNLKEVVIPASAVNIGKNIAYSCTDLTTYTVDAKNPNYKTVDGILYTNDMQTLVSCPAGKKTFTNKGEFVCPDSVKTIEDGAFNGCFGLTKIVLSSGLEKIGRSAFSSGALTELTLPDGLKIIGDNAFHSQSQLTSVTIPASVKAIENHTFTNCPKLAEVTLLEGLEMIDDDAFANCKALTSVLIPKSVEHIGWNAFGVTYEPNVTGESPNEVVNGNFVMYAYRSDCDAHRYAHDVGVKFQLIADNVRMAGADRFATANSIALTAFKDGAKTVVIADGMNFADALTGSAYATSLNAPILLTQSDKLPDSTAEAIKKLNAENVVILGGEKAVSKSVEDALKKNGIKKIERVYGQDRFETAVQIASSLNGKDSPENLFFVVNDTSADALSVSAVAGATKSPILFVQRGKDDLDDATKAYVEKIKSGVKNVYIIGGNVPVSEKAQAAIDKLTGKKSVRLAGTDRYATNIEILKQFAGGPNKALTGACAALANGADTSFADALAGSVAAALNKGPIVLTDGKELTKAQKDIIAAQKPPVNQFAIAVFGGEKVVPEKIAREACMSVKLEDTHGDEGTKFEDSNLYKFMQKLDTEPFEMEVVLDFMGTKMTSLMRKNSEATYAQTTSLLDGEIEETYTIGGKSYVLNPSKKTYHEEADEAGADSILSMMFAEGASYEVVSTNEDSGLIIERIKITEKDGDQTKTSEGTFKFSKATGILVSVENENSEIKIAVEIKSFKVGPQEIKLPDLSDWTKEDDDDDGDFDF